MNKRKKRLKAQIGTFMKQYSRKTKNAPDPNDRTYDRNLEKEIKKMDPRELDELMHGDDE